jgi:hypothetical protein
LRSQKQNQRVETIMTALPSSPLSAAKTALFLAAGVFALASPAAAQQAATPVAPVTVQGTASPATVNRQTSSFVQSYAAAANPEINQIGRWQGAVCVHVGGLVPAQAAQVAGRIEDVAGSVGLAVLKPGCRSNIEVVFTDKPQAVLDKVPEPYLGFHYQTNLKKVRAVTHPVQAWYATATVGAGGATGLAFGGGNGRGPDPDNSDNWEANFGQIQGVQLSMDVVDSPDQTAPVGCADAPHFTSCLRSMFRNILIVVDDNAVAGKNLGPLTDYLAMLALAQPKSLDGCNALPSVIDMFAKSDCPGRDRPDALTPSDAAYLTALYASDPEAKMPLAQADISGRMAKILVNARTQNR